METTKKRIQQEEDNLITQIMHRFFPYWPIFLFFGIVSVACAYVYLRYAPPLYDISATLMIKDEKKGSSDSKAMQSLNIFTSNDIVENEMEVLHSQQLMKEVVTKLGLYAPVSTEGRVNAISAYTSSPLSIYFKNADDLDTSRGASKVYFRYDSLKRTVNLENKKYPVDEWVNTPYGVLKFTANPNYKRADSKPFYFSLVSPKIVAASLAGRLSVSQPNKLSSVVKLVLQDESPKRGEDILNELINTYNAASIDDKNEFSAKTLSIVTEKIADVQHQVDSIQRLVNEYKEKNGIVNLSEQSTLFLQNVGSNDQKIADVNRQIAILDEVEKYVNSSRTEGVIPSTLGINDPVLVNLLQRLYDLEINSQRLKMTATENNPQLVSLANDIEKTKKNILENTRVQRISLSTSRDNLSSTLANYSSKLKNIPDKERDLIEISRQLAALNSTYDFLLQKKEEASLSNASTLGNSRIIDKAQSSLWPTSPQKMIVLAIAVFAALGAGCLIVLWKEVFSGKILFRSDINKHTSIPVVAEIFNIKKNRLTEKEKNTLTNEQFRQLAAGMGLYGRNTVKKKILITSSITGEGKSFVSYNLSSCLAMSGKKVVLLDFDFRNPNTSRTFAINDEVGIANFLEGEKEPYEIIKSTDKDNLFVCSAGTIPLEKTSELLLSERLREFFCYMEDVFDFIIIDTPPMEPISDAYILSEYCDCALYVIKHGYTPKTIVRLLDENNKIKALKNVAIVFNALRPRGFVKQSYGYGYGFSYEYKYNQKRKKKKALS